MKDSSYTKPLVGTIEPVFMSRDLEERDIKMMAQGRNYRVMTKNGWSYTIGSRTAELIAERELLNAYQL